MTIYLTGVAAAFIMLLIYLAFQACFIEDGKQDEWQTEDSVIFAGVLLFSWIGAFIVFANLCDSVHYYIKKNRK